MIDERIWNEMSAAYPDETGLVRRRVLEDCPFDAFVAVAQPLRKRLLVLRLADDVTLPHLPVTRSITNVVVKLADGALEIRVELEEPDMSGVFTPFIQDVIACVGLTNTQQAALDVLAQRIAHWRNLLSGGPGGLGAAGIQGLFAELWTLRHVLAPALGVCVAVGAWTGPDRALRDFVLGGSAVEVKSTHSRPPAAITVTSEMQLSTMDLDSLFLVAIEFDAAAGLNGMSLPELIDQLRQEAAGCRAQFEERLREWGYLEAHRGSYSQPRLVIRQLHIFEVAESFPRIVPQDVPAGVGEVRYRLALGACEPWRVDPAATSLWLKESMGGGGNSYGA
jgi:hypothetical protein